MLFCTSLLLAAVACSGPDSTVPDLPTAAVTPSGSQYPPTATLTLSPKPGAVKLGESLQIVATLKDNTGKPITPPANAFTQWATTSARVATVTNSGRVTGRSLGTVTVLALIGGQSAMTTVQVTNTGTVQVTNTGTPATTTQPSTQGTGEPTMPPVTPPDDPAGTRLPGQLFPANNWWNQDISNAPVDPHSSQMAHGCGWEGYGGKPAPLHPDFGTTYRGVPNGIPYNVVHSGQRTVAVKFWTSDESDHVPYPIPSDAKIENDGASGDVDHHLLVVDVDNQKLYELYNAVRPGTGHPEWRASSGAVFDLRSNTLRPAGWTSADAAGLPIMPGLIRYDEVTSGAINHALRMTCQHVKRAYVWPARHYAGWNSSPTYDKSGPPMGARFRLKANVDISRFSPQDQVILRALKKYGAFIADIGGPYFISGAPDSRWNNDDLHSLGRLNENDFEVVQMGQVTTP